jgi:putative transcriptional regulator
MDRKGISETTESVLKTAGFQISEKCCSRPCCFCFVARKDACIFFVEAPTDLGNVSQKNASELKMITSWFDATPLLICEKTREKPLEDDTIYSRYDVFAVTPNTLENAVSRGLSPLIEAGPGGYFVQLDAEAIKNRRQKLGLSVGKLAELLGISRRTLYGYERGMAKASVSVAYNLEWVLGILAVKPINIFVPVHSSEGFLATAKRVMVKNRFLQKVLKRLSQCHFDVAPMMSAPFDFIAKSKELQLNILGGITNGYEKNLDKRTKEILSVSEVVKAQPVLVTDGDLIPDNIPSIHSQELDEMRNPKDLITKF